MIGEDRDATGRDHVPVAEHQTQRERRGSAERSGHAAERVD
jgi:hypothetical protein